MRRQVVIPFSQSENILHDLSFMECLSSAVLLWHTIVQQRKTIYQIFPNLDWIYGKFPKLSEIQKVSNLFINVFIRILRTNLDLLILVFSVLFGKMIESSHVINLLNAANIHMHPMVGGTTHHWLDFSYSIDSKRLDGFDYVTLLLIVFWTLDLWDVGGLYLGICKTMTSIHMNGKHRMLKTSNNFESDSNMDINNLDSTNEDIVIKYEANNPLIELKLDENLERGKLDESSVQLDTEDEWEVLDEEVVYVDFEGLLEHDIFVPNTSVRFVDLETNKPLIQV